MRSFYSSTDFFYEAREVIFGYLSVCIYDRVEMVKALLWFARCSKRLCPIGAVCADVVYAPIISHPIVQAAVEGLAQSVLVNRAVASKANKDLGRLLLPEEPNIVFRQTDFSIVSGSNR